AHAEVFNVLLQVLDDGRMTDGQGRTVDFKNSVIIMTSNALTGGGESRLEIRDSSPTSNLQSLSKDEIIRQLQRIFRPEFLNRIDEIVVFHSLGAEQLAKIVEIQLSRLRKLLEERKIELQVSDQARAHIARVGYEPMFGARPLKRVIQHELQDPLSMAILGGRYPEGSTVHVDEKDGELILE
ncbi:MAG TPA: AAA family ATPase, partial [Anaerolineae bacterium]